MGKRGFILFYDYEEQFCSLSDAACGQLVKAIFAYEINGIKPKLPPRADMAFMFIKNALDENREKYFDVCKKRSEAGRKSGEVRREKAINKMSKCSDLQTKRTDTDTETETETETVTVTETETETNTEAAMSCPPKATHTLSRTARGEFSNVYLSDEEYAKLTDEYGLDTANDAVNLLSTRIARDNRYKNENHYATIKSWVITALYEQRQKKAELEERKKASSPQKKPMPPGFDFDFEDIFEKP